MLQITINRRIKQYAQHRRSDDQPRTNPDIHITPIRHVMETSGGVGTACALA